MAERIRAPGPADRGDDVLRFAPLLVAYARLYGGMHHVTDVVAGLLNGVVSLTLAWRYLRRKARQRSRHTLAYLARANE